MKKVILFILLFLFTQQTFTQNWTEPINVSNMEGFDQQPHFSVDNEGVIHCVWNHVLENNYSQIFYSKSYDEGLSWTEGVNISLNEEKRLSSPHIVVDSENYLHLAYNYNTGNPIQTQVHYKTFDGTTWSDVLVVSEDQLECHHNRLVIDNTDRIYIFWFSTLYQNGTTFYRYFENGVWSEVVIPYDNDDKLFFSNCVVDNQNNLHWIGSHYYQGQSMDDNRVVYFSYNLVTNLWSNIIEFGEYKSWHEKDIALDSNKHTHIVWQEYTNENAPPNDGTFYAINDGIQWSMPELIVEDPIQQQIIIDKNNNVNLFDVEKVDEGSMLVHYTNTFGSWEGSIVDESEWYGMAPYVEECNDSLYLIYQKPIGVEEDGEVFFVKSDFVSSIALKSEKAFETNLSPNPFQSKVNIEIQLNNSETLSIQVFSIQGKLLKNIVQRKMKPGNYHFEWEGSNQSGGKVMSGTYLIRIRSGRKIKTQSVELIR